MDRSKMKMRWLKRKIQLISLNLFFFAFSFESAELLMMMIDDQGQSKKKISIERVECFKRMIGTNKKIVTKLVDFFRYLKRKLDKILSDERNLKLSFCFLIRKILFACNVFFLNSFHFGSKCFGSFRL